MTKKRVSTDIDRKLRSDLDEKAKALEISRAKLIESAIKSELGRFNLHKENRRLTESKAKLEDKISELEVEVNRLESEKSQLAIKHIDRIREIAVALGVPDTIGHIKQRIEELKKQCQQLGSEKTQLTEQRDEFEHLLHAETDSYNKCYERAESLKKERDTFKARWETSQEELSVAGGKLNLLLTRNWWERLRNILPWIEK